MDTLATLLSKRWFEEVWNQRRIETVHELLDDDSVCYGEGEPIVGKEAFIERLFLPMTAAFPDLKLTIEDAIGSDERAVIRWSATGSHSGRGLGIEPTGRAIEVQGMTWLCIVNGKLTEGWQYSNLGEALSKLSAPASQSDSCRLSSVESVRD